MGYRSNVRRPIAGGLATQEGRQTCLFTAVKLSHSIFTRIEEGKPRMLPYKIVVEKSAHYNLLVRLLKNSRRRKDWSFGTHTFKRHHTERTPPPSSLCWFWSAASSTTNRTKHRLSLFAPLPHEAPANPRPGLRHLVPPFLTVSGLVLHVTLTYVLCDSCHAAA